MQAAFEKIIEKLNSKKAYFQRFYECEGKSEHDADLNKSTQLAYDDAIEIIKQEAEKYNNGWVPCSERLPKYGEVVMCYCTNSGITISCITHKGVKPSKSVRFGQHSVIAWQPLPKPFQKGE